MSRRRAYKPSRRCENPRAGEADVYRVFAFTAADLDVYVFSGPDARDDARAWYDRLKKDPAVVQVFATCRTATGWRVVARPVRRTDRGKWPVGGWE